MIRSALILFASCLVMAAAAGHAPTTVVRTEANVPVEMTLTARQPHPDPFNRVQVDVLLTDP